MNNKYSQTVLGIMLGLLAIGILLAVNSIWWGIIPFIVGALMTRGFKILSSSPREIGLIAFMGEKTTEMVEGWTLLFEPFGWEIVSVVKFDVRRTDLPEFKIENITCDDNCQVYGTVSMQVRANFSDGKLLKEFDDVGRIDGIKNILDGILETSIQEIAREGKHDSDYMTTQGAEIKEKLMKKIEGKVKNGNKLDTDKTDDTREMGFEITKMVIKLFKPKNIQDAAQMGLVTKAMNERIKMRLAFHRENGTNPMPSIAEVRKELVAEDVSDRGLYQIIDGGNLVNFTNATGGKK